LLAGLLLAASGWVSAGGFSLSPLGVTLSPRESSASISVENTGDAPLVIQVRVLQWTQRDGKDLREETRELIVNPPIFKLGPGEQQLVRFASRLPPPRDAERAYRAVFTEVPPRDAPMPQSGFRVAVAMDVPVFVESPAQATAADLRWRVTRTEAGVRLRVENPGNVHRRLRDPEINAGGKTLYKQGFVVILPGSSLDIDLPAPPPGAATMQLVASDSDQKIAIDLPFPPAQ
jgi:fimbrial chaperone protein